MVPTLVELGLLITAALAAGKVVADMPQVYPNSRDLKASFNPDFAYFLD
jgi:hypothetical protein